MRTLSLREERWWYPSYREGQEMMLPTPWNSRRDAYPFYGGRRWCSSPYRKTKGDDVLHKEKGCLSLDRKGDDALLHKEKGGLLMSFLWGKRGATLLHTEMRGWCSPWCREGSKMVLSILWKEGCSCFPWRRDGDDVFLTVEKAVRWFSILL